MHRRAIDQAVPGHSTLLDVHTAQDPGGQAGGAHGHARQAHMHCSSAGTAPRDCRFADASCLPEDITRHSPTPDSDLGFREQKVFAITYCSIKLRM